MPFLHLFIHMPDTANYAVPLKQYEIWWNPRLKSLSFFMMMMMIWPSSKHRFSWKTKKCGAPPS